MSSIGLDQITNKPCDHPVSVSLGFRLITYKFLLLMKVIHFQHFALVAYVNSYTKISNVLFSSS